MLPTRDTQRTNLTLVAWETLSYFSRYQHKKQEFVIGKRPDFFNNGVIPTQRDWQTYQNHTYRKNPILEAYRSKQMLELPSVVTYAQVADILNTSRVRVCQYLNLLKLPKKVVEFVENTKDPVLLSYFSERRLRTLTQIKDEKDQLQQFKEMLSEIK
ncbi:MAG: hypothetical protein HY762_02460 [Planctomycetes bacterium]|nr:hypothetical protein [Planctomycetota bacterium]